MSRILALLRMGIFLFLLLVYVSFYLLWLKVRPMTMDERFVVRERFCKLGMWIFGIKARVEGEPLHEHGPHLIVCNHRSLVDPLICARYIFAYFLSKAEIKNYPLIGVGSRLTGVIFVERDNKTSRSKTREAIRVALEEGKNVMVYPEGTTSAGELTKQFYKGSFEVAQEAGVPVIPVVIEYRERSDYWTDGGLLAKFIEQFSKWRSEVYLYIGEEVKEESAMKTLETCQAIMDKKIVQVHRQWGNVK